MDKKQISKRYLSLFLALIMLIGTLPMNIFAQEPTTGTCTADPNKVSSSNIVKDEDKKEKTNKKENGVIVEGFDEHGQEYVAADKVITKAVQATNERGVFGRAYDMTGNDFNAADNNNPLPDGTVIYFQWMDSDGVKSPIFTCKTYHVGTGAKDGGWYAYDPTKLDFKDGNGKVHKLAYQTVRQYYRFWLAPGQKSPNGNIWTTARQAPGGQVGFYRATQSAAGTFMLAGTNYQKTSVFVYETPDDISYMVAPKVNSTFTGKNGQTYPRYKIDKVGIEEEKGIDNYITGKVWWELSDNLVSFPTSSADTQVPQNTTEDGLKGIRVITSVLTAEGANALKNVNNLPINERISKTKDILTKHPEYIMQTVEAPVVYERGGNVSKYVARFDDQFDLDFIYQFVIDGKGNVLNVQNMSPVPVFSNPRTFVLNTAAKTPFKNALYNVHNALVNDPFKSSIHITNYDTTVEGAASPGDVVKTSVEANFLPGNKVEIVWVDADGNELSETEVTSKENAEKQTFKVPENLTEKTAYSVQLRINGIIIDSDSFIADPSTKIRLHRNSSADDKYVDIIKVEDPDSQKVELQALRNTDKYQEVQNKYFVGWSTNKDATQPDENVLIDKTNLKENSTTDLYVRDGSIYKYRDANCVPVKDLYAVWKGPMTVRASKKWVDTVAANYDTSKLKFGLLHRAAVGTFGKEVVAGLATYEPVPGQIKPYNANGIVWDNLPSYKEEGKRISYLIVELPTQEMVDKYNAGSTDWKSYNINVVEVDAGAYKYHKKEQTLSMINKTTSKPDAITSSTKRLHIINGQAVDPHDPSLTAKPGYFDTQGYVITVTNKKQTLTPPSIEQAKSGDKELVINLKAGEDIDGLKGTFTSNGTATDFVIKKGSGTNDWTITKADGSAINGVTVDTSKSTADKVVLKLDDAHALKADDKLVARTYKTVGGNYVVSSDDSMTVKDNNSRLPRNIKQAYSDKDDKVIITATPFQQDVNGQMITVVPSNTTYTLVDKDGNQIDGTPIVTANNNEIKFEIDKSKVSEGTEYFIQAKEPDRDAKDTREVAGDASEKGVPSDKSVKLDLTAPQATIPYVKGFVGNKIDDKTFDITEASEKINIIEREGPNGLKSSINGTQVTIYGTPTVPYNGKTKMIVEDMFGNKATLTGKADIYAKVVDKVPTGEEKNYYSVTFKSDDNSWLLKNGVKISEITKYIIKDFNGDGQVTADDKITLAQAEDEGLIIPDYDVREGYKEKAPKWNPNFEAQDYKFGTDDAVFTLQTEKLQSIIPVKPGNDGTLPETPKGYVRVTLDKDNTVKFKDNVETIYDVRVADKVRYADVYKKVEAQPVDNNYKNVSWYEGDKKVNGSDSITKETTLIAKAENDKPIIPVEDPDANPNPPAGYVRITIEKGDRIESVTGVTTYDVKSDGSVRYGDIIDEITKDGSKTVITIAKDDQGNPTGRLPYTWKVDNADVVREAGPGTEAKTLTVSATMLDKDTYNPEGFEQTVKQGDTPQAKDSIKNKEDLPEGTTYKFVKEDPANSGKFIEDSPKTDTIGEVPVKVEVTYPDGTKDIVDTKIKVVPKDNIIPVKPGNGGTLPDTPKDYVRVTLTKDDTSIKDYATGTVTVYDVKKDAGVRLGDILNKVKPEAKDGYKNPKWYVNNADADPLTPINAKVTANAKAEKTDANTYDPKGTVQNVEKDSTPDPKKSIGNPENLPEGTTYKYVKEETDGNGKKTYTPETPDTSTIGKKDVKVQVTYPDGSTDIVETKINVVPKDKIIKVDDPDNNPTPRDGYVRVTLVNDPTSVQTYKEAYDVKKDGTVLYGDVINRATVPQPSAGYKEPIVWKNGDTVQDVRATVPGTENVTLTAFATKTYANTYDPQGQVQNVEKGSTPDPKKSIANPEDLPKGTEFKYVKEETDNEGKKTYTPENPDTSTTGEKDVKVQVTYPDGSTDIVETKIKVVEKAKKISEELEGKLEGKDINVWKDSPVDEINWKDGVKLNDANKGNETYKGYLENATAEEATDPARKTDVVGTKAGQIKVTFEDGSSLLVDKQNLVVKDNILPGDDENAPKDAIEVKFLLGEGVKATKDGAEITGDKTTPAEYASYKIKPGTNLKSYKYAQAPSTEEKTIFEIINATVIDDTYENVVWKGNVTNDPTNYVVSKDNNEFTAYANKKASNKDIIPFVPDKPDDPTNPDDKNVPTEDPDGNPINKDDYVIVAFKIGQPGAATLVLDGKKGEVVSALVKKTDPLKKWSEITIPTIGQTMDQNNQYTFEKWVDAAKAEMTADKQIADKAVYTATFKTNNGFDKDAIIGFNFVKDPTKIEYNEGDKPKHDGLEIELVDKNNNKVTVTKDKLEEYGITIEPTEDTALKKDDDGKHLVAKITTKDGDGQDKELTASSPGTLKVKEKSDKDIIPFVPDKPDDPTNSDDKNVPTEDHDGNPINKDDYVIVAFKIGQPGAATLVLDGKKGEVVSALVKKTDPLKKWSEITIPTIGQTMDQNNQYTFEKWVDAAKAEMTADKEIADKAVYTATFKTNDGFDKDAIIGFNFVKDPTKMEYNEGDKPKHDGLEIELVDRNNNKVTVTKDKLKDYGITIEPTEDTALTKDDDGKHLVAKITTKDGDGQDKELTASSPGTLTVNDKANPEQSSKPTVKQPTEDDKKIEGKGVPGSKIVVKDKDGNVIGETEVNEKGEWEVPVPADKPLKKDDKITVEQTEKGKKPSTAETTVKGKEDTTANPTIDQPTEGDNKITGKGEPGSKIVVDLPDGTKIPGEVDDNGNWTVDVPADKPLIPGDTIKVTQTDKNGKTKEATATVASRFKPEPIPTPGYNPWWPIYFGSTKTEVKPEPKDLERHEAYIAGYPDGTVRPDGKITRAEVTAILARLTENSSLANFVARFSDVKAFDWFSDSIMKLSAKDIITGYPDGTFKPNKSITRAEFAVIASKYIKNPKAADETFSDVPMNHWAKDAIAKVKAEGWISGYNDGTFKPDAPITRAEAVSIVNRMFNRAADGEFVRDHNYEISNFKDLLESHWAYYDMIEATHTHDFESLNGGIERWEKIVK